MDEQRFLVWCDRCDLEVVADYDDAQDCKRLHDPWCAMEAVIDIDRDMRLFNLW